MSILTIRRLISQRPSKECYEERRSNALWWKEHRTSQRFLIKPQYASKYAMSDKTEWHTKEDFVPSVFEKLTKICEAIDNGERRYTEDPKSSMPGFAVGEVVEDFAETKVTGENFLSTQILVLDIDEVPRSVNNIGLWLSHVLPQGVEAFWYSTPRWTQEQKRIRIVVPLSREITMEEKKNMAFRLKIDGIDPASFEAGKFSLLPCWCKDTVDFQWGKVGSRPLDPDNDLPAYIPQRVVKSSAPRMHLPQVVEEELDTLVEEINDAPDGHSQEIIKPGLSKLFRKYFITAEQCEDFAQYIVRDDRRKDFIGIANWLERKYDTRKN